MFYSDVFEIILILGILKIRVRFTHTWNIGSPTFPPFSYMPQRTVFFNSIGTITLLKPNYHQRHPPPLLPLVLVLLIKVVSTSPLMLFRLGCIFCCPLATIIYIRPTDIGCFISYFYKGGEIDEILLTVEIIRPDILVLTYLPFIMSKFYKPCIHGPWDNAIDIN